MKYVIISIFSLFFFLYYNQVDNSLTQEDIYEIEKSFNDISNKTASTSYEQELSIIKEVQSRVIDLAPDHSGIPKNQKREIKELFTAKSGLCYDRSRTIEKILRYKGFETRHVSVFSVDNYSPISYLRSLSSRGINSHAVSEVLSRKGWLLLGSNYKWLSLDSNLEPINIAKIQEKQKANDVIYWKVAPMTDIYDEPFTFFYGLYSRHGYFYPPFNFFPDINYSEFMYNFI